MQIETQHLRIIACPHILSMEKGRIDVQRPAGGNVKDLLRSIAWTPDSMHARVFIDGVYVKDAAWETTVPGPGQSIVVRAIPMGGGGENQGKDIGRMVAMVSIMVLAVATQQYWAVPLLGMSAATVFAVGIAAISITTSLALTGLIPQPLPRRALPQPLDDRREVAA